MKRMTADWRGSIGVVGKGSFNLWLSQAPRKNRAFLFVNPCEKILEYG
jgi:hypothetical protein